MENRSTASHHPDFQLRSVRLSENDPTVPIRNRGKYYFCIVLTINKIIHWQEWIQDAPDLNAQDLIPIFKQMAEFLDRTANKH